MKRFAFRLARLQRVRAIQEASARELWLAAETLAGAAERELDQARAASAGAHGELRDLTRAPELAVARVLVAERELGRLARLERHVRERALTLRDRAERLRVPWQARRREVAGLERLEERDRDAWRAEERRRDASAMDEIAESRAARARPRRAAEPQGMPATSRSNPTSEAHPA